MRSEEVSVLSGGVGLHLEAHALTGPQREEAGTTQDGEVHEDVGLERLRTKGTPAVVVAPPNTNAFDDLHDRNVPRRGVRQWIVYRTERGEQEGVLRKDDRDFSRNVVP